MPGGVLAQQPGGGAGGRAGQVAVQPGLEVQQLLVGGGQHAAGHEQVTQVGDGTPVRLGGQRLMGEGDLAGRQV